MSRLADKNFRARAKASLTLLDFSISMHASSLASGFHLQSLYHKLVRNNVKSRYVVFGHRSK